MERFLLFCSDAYQNKKSHLRWGQTLYNTCKKMFPDIVIPENIDPFYDDQKIPEFLKFILEECLWN